MAEEWFYAHRGVRHGPVSGERLQSLADAGQLDPDDLVWAEGMASWVPGRDVPGLFPPPDWASPPPVGPSPQGLSFLTPGPPPPNRPAAVAFGQGGTTSGGRPDLHPWQDPPPRREGGSRNAFLLAAAALIVTVGVYFLGSNLSLLGGGKRSGPREFALASGEAREFFIEFPEGKQAHIWVTSRENSDVDVFVHDSAGRLVASDVRFDKDCYVTWTPARTQTYKVVVANRVLVGGPAGGRNRSNYCTLKHFPE